MSRVTWLLPVKNGMPYLRRTLASIAEQTLGGATVLAWDNGSEDGSQEEIRRWIPQKIAGEVRIGKPLPLGRCLAVMVEQARTEFCARIDADDVNLPERLERQVDFLDAHPEIAVAGAQVTRIDEEGRPWGEEIRLPTHDADIMNRMLHNWVLWHPTVLLRRKVVLEAGNYGDYVPGQDYELWYRVAARGRLANLPDVLLFYRVHSESITAITDSRRRQCLNQFFARNASALFGLTVDEAMALREGQLRFAFPILLRVCKRLSDRQGDPLWKQMRRPSFVQAGLRLTPRRDYITRAIFSLLGGPTRPVKRQVKKLMEVKVKGNKGVRSEE